MASVAGDVLALEFIGGASDPGDSILNLLVVGNMFGGVHPVVIFT